MNQCLEENKILTSRLIDAALQNDDDLFDAAFADPDDEPAPKPKAKPTKPQLDPEAQAAQEAEQAEKRRQAEAAQKRQQELAQQVCNAAMACHAVSKHAVVYLHPVPCSQCCIRQRWTLYRFCRSACDSTADACQAKEREEQQKVDAERRAVLNQRASMQVTLSCQSDACPMLLH